MDLGWEVISKMGPKQLISRDKIMPVVSWSLLDGILGLVSSVWGWEQGLRGACSPDHQSLKANSKTGV